jgi:transposase
MSVDCHFEEPTAIRSHIGAIFVSLELSRSNWLITSVSHGAGEKISKRSVPSGDSAGLLARFAELRRKALARDGGKAFPSLSFKRPVWTGSGFIAF